MSNTRFSALAVLDFINAKDFEKVQDLCFYDWFCKTESLPAKTKTLSAKFKAISKSSKFDLKNVAVHFKNNCPVNGRLYDDIRISDIITGNNLYVIVPSSGYRNELGEAQVYSRENGFETPVVKGTWADVKAYFAN